MYSERVIRKVVDDFSIREGWTPTFRTIAEVDELIGYIESLVDDSDSNSVTKYFSWKKGKRPSDRRIEWIKDQILNEQFCCFASAEYFVTRYGRIRDVEERTI